MADDIEIGSKAIKQIQELRAELIKLSQDVQNVNKNTINIKTPSALGASNNSNAKAISELETLKEKYTSLSDTIARKAEQSRLAEIRLQVAREKAFDSFEKNAQKEEAALKKAEGAYQRIQNSINLLTKTYNDLAIRKELGNTLTAKEEKQLTALSARINTYQTALKNTDAQIGKNQRNVGNYASGFDSLGNSINQLTREAPAFAVSLNTGFMALSNNIPIFTDEIIKLTNANKELAKSGQPTKSVLGQIATSFFSLQTAISLGVTLLTLYGGKLVEWVSSLTKSDSAIKSLKENQTSLNEAISKGNKDAAKEISQLDILYRTATNVALSTEQRQKAVNKLQKEYPSYFANIQDEIILNGKATKSYVALREAIFDSARAKAIQSELEKRAEGRLEKELEIRESIADSENRLAKQRANPKAFLGGEDNAEIFSAEQVTKNLQNNLNKRKKELEDYRKRSLQEDDLLLKSKEKFEKNSAVLESDRIKITEPKVKKEKQDKREKIEALNLEGKAIGTTVEQLDKYISALDTELILNAGNETAYKNIKTALEQVKKAKNDLITGNGEIISSANIRQVSTDVEVLKTKLSELQKQYLESFSAEFFQNSGFSETFRMLNKDIDGFGENFSVTFNAIAESAQEAFNFISNASQQNFDAERERLQNQYDVSLAFAGENKAAQEKLAEDLEKQKKDIANRENKAKQKQAIFNIGIDLAQAIVGLWAKPGFPAAIPLVATVAALGAAQIALVASQKIPQYWMGGTHEGGLMMVNDGSGPNFKETIVTPDGNIHKPEGKNVIMNAPKGTEIFTHDQWNEQMNGMLKGNGINWNFPQRQSSGITKEDMKSAMLEAIGEQPQYHSNFDANGAVSYIVKKGNITRSASNRGNSIKTRFT